MTSNPTSLSAVVFDWAGTIIDFGSCAPMGAFVRLFEQFGIDLSIDEARGPMGMAKWDHIQALGTLPRIATQWQAAPRIVPAWKSSWKPNQTWLGLGRLSAYTTAPAE